ncbi:MAG: alkaline phosphatase family protein [Sedimentisphaerales bacterium]|nr:alkaline phosphatase family protein [Sedimentisphaerales bacterium]
MRKDSILRYYKAVFCFTLLCFFLPGTAQAYIGPGAGFAVAGSFFVMFTAFISAMAALLTWPIRYIIRAIRGRKAFARAKCKRFVVLGLDGLDPNLAEKFMQEGKLPNFAKLKEQGTFSKLHSTIPPISPVAWSSFQTGSNPGKHNIFDFLTRDKQNYFPKLSSMEINAPKRMLNIGKYQIPIGKANMRLLRKGKPFWKTLGEHGIFSNILRVPITFPPEKFKGLQISAMCVPDMQGSQGTFSFYTTQDMSNIEHTGGKNYTVTRNNGTIKSDLYGSENPLRKDKSMMKCPFMITITGKNSAKLEINGETHDLKTGEYSEWVKADFKLAPTMSAHGICRFLLISTEPEFQLYVTPINHDPENPSMPISYPSVYSCYFAKLNGSYATLGLAEDTWALNEKVLNDKTFLEQTWQIDNEREKMFFDAMDKTKHGLVVCVFDGTDRIQHTFWRYIDDKHPAHAGQDPADIQQRDAIEQLYIKADGLVGRTMEKCRDKNTVLMVISDHGFNSFRYGVDLNRWLEENGYLKVIEEKRDEKYCVGIDWSQTKAFSIGLTGIFLNIRGRESQGIVDPGQEAAQLRDEIAAKLSELHDAKRNTKAIKQVYNALKVYKGPYKTEAPDLIVGYHEGYRASWDTAVGKVTKEVFHDNTKAWSGDHCIDQSIVPGVLFCNRKVDSENPRLLDIGPTVLDMFGVDVPSNMDGKALKITDDKETAGKDSDKAA